jgi:hypothetical protein
MHTRLGATILHPNEMLDGALVNGNYRAPGRVLPLRTAITPSFEVYRRHADDLNFSGVSRPRLARYASSKNVRVDDGAGGLPDGGPDRHRVG